MTGSGDGKKGLMVVSFGTTHGKTCEETIGAIEAHLAKAMPDRKLYRAWTSGMIIRRLKERDGICVDSVDEALERMKGEGVRDLLVAATHMIAGSETEKLRAVLETRREEFETISLSRPLLGSDEDVLELAKVIAREHPLDEAGLVLMGHGSSERPEANRVYVELEKRFRTLGYENVFVGTVEGRPDLEDVAAKIREGHSLPAGGRMLLAPLMIVAGDHALNDMAGDGEDSWKNILAGEGVKVETVMKGLGSYPGVWKMFEEHGKNADILG